MVGGSRLEAVSMVKEDQNVCPERGKVNQKRVISFITHACRNRSVSEFHGKYWT